MGRDDLIPYRLPLHSKKRTPASAEKPSVTVVFFQLGADHHGRGEEVVEGGGVGDDAEQRA